MWNVDNEHFSVTDTDLRVFNIHHEEPILSMGEADFEIGLFEPYNAVWSPDGTQLAVASKYQRVFIWDLVANQITQEDWISGRNITWHPEGNMLATAIGNSKVVIWDLDTQDRFAEVELDVGYVTTLAWSPDGDLLLIGSNQGQLFSWNVFQ
jgi:Tol biopolymer transport system component